jgi:hypothetical protein
MCRLDDTHTCLKASCRSARTTGHVQSCQGVIHGSHNFRQCACPGLQICHVVVDMQFPWPSLLSQSQYGTINDWDESTSPSYCLQYTFTLGAEPGLVHCATALGPKLVYQYALDLPLTRHITTASLWSKRDELMATTMYCRSTALPVGC